MPRIFFNHWLEPFQPACQFTADLVGAMCAPASWNAAALCRFSIAAEAAPSGRGLPHSKTSRKPRADFFNYICNFSKVTPLLVICLLALTGSLRAAELAVGDAVPAFVAKDQFGKEFKCAPGLKFLLLGFDMTVGKAANQKLTNLGAGGLERYGAAYVLDVHTMPAVARIFALPKMRKYSHRVILAETEGLLAAFPHQTEKITVLVLTPDGKIKEIRYWNPATEATASVFN